jgi:hypothetical protein
MKKVYEGRMFVKAASTSWKNGSTSRKNGRKEVANEIFTKEGRCCMREGKKYTVLSPSDIIFVR